MWNFSILWPCVFKTVSFSSYFHLSHALFVQVLCYANSIASQDFCYFKNCIPDVLPGKLNDYRPRFTASMFFPSRWDLSMSLIDTFSCISFSKISMTISSVFSFSCSFTSWIRSQLLLEHYSWRSRLQSIFTIF